MATATIKAATPPAAKPGAAFAPKAAGKTAPAKGVVAPASPPVKTILGVDLRRRIVKAVNGLGRGQKIRVSFRGTRAYTNGRDIVLPKIKDLAEIPYTTARALIGYAIHEVAHILFTDFDQVARAYDEGKEVKKFENCIEDYRIEREMTRKFVGAGADLTALRIAIHPKLSSLTTGWLADPRACGALALTWTGSRLNGFPNPGVQKTLDAMPAPVVALIENWTERMKDVASTEEAVDLAIQFKKEADAYAAASRLPAIQKPNKPSQDPKDEASDENDAADKDDDKSGVDPEENKPQQPGNQETDEDPGLSAPDLGCEKNEDEVAENLKGEGEQSEDGPVGDGEEGDDASDGEDGEQGDADDDHESTSDGAAGDESDDQSEDQGGGKADEQGQDGEGEGDPADAEAGSGGGDPAESSEQGEGDRVGEDGATHGDSAKDTNGDKGDPNQSGANGDGSETEPQAGGDAEEDAPMDSSSPNSEAEASPSREDGSDQGADGVDFNGSKSGEGKPSSGGKPGAPSDDARIGMNDGLLDEHRDEDGDDEGGKPEKAEREEGEPSTRSQEDPDRETETETSEQEDGASQAPATGTMEDGEDPAQRQPQDDDGEDDAPQQGPAFDEQGDEAGGAEEDPFADALDDDARMDDMIDDMIEQIRENGPLPEESPEESPEATDGEVDPSEVLKDVKDANKAAPNYSSNAGDQTDEAQKPGEGPGASKHHYDDTRFKPIEPAGDNCQYETMRNKAAGTISTTARIIKRLLMAEDKSGTVRNRRSGTFDIRNMGAIIRSTGTCYKKEWQKPSPKTLLAMLVDFSGSMSYSWNPNGKQDDTSPITLAMMGALATEKATQGTSVNTAIYGYTGHSPNVQLTVFKEGPQSSNATRKKIGAYAEVVMDCTPTGEAMAALAMRMEESDEERKVMLVLTDGTADDMQLCAAVSRLLIKRGIEVVAIGIKNDSVADWAPVHHVIHEISQLPQALMQTIDPRMAKKAARMAA
jgi:cobalamin biosynthesis protein CobT